MYWIKENRYIVGKAKLEGAMAVPKRPNSAHIWNGNEWVFGGYTAEESINKLRKERNQLLEQTDWRMVSDYPGSNQSEWQTYRQALRDITTQTPSLDSNGNLTGITWPTPPEN